MSDYDGGQAWIASLNANPHGAVHGEAPCATCGTPTTRRATVGVRCTNPISSEMTLTPELVAICLACEAKRVRAQLERIAANENVVPRLREDARRALEEA